MSTIRAVAALFLCGLMAASAEAQERCRPFCAPSFKVEPTVTVTNLFGGARIIQADGVTTREPRETEFEVILSVGLPTRISWLEFTVEAIFLPFDRESTPELEFETNLIWLPSARTGGWLSSHVDVVDKFSPAERSTDGAGVHAQTQYRMGYEPRGIQLAARWTLAASGGTGRLARLCRDWIAAQGRHH